MNRTRKGRTAGVHTRLRGRSRYGAAKARSGWTRAGMHGVSGAPDPADLLRLGTAAPRLR